MGAGRLAEGLCDRVGGLLSGAVDQVERGVLRGRDLAGVRVRVRYLDLLAVSLGPLGWGCVPLYRLPVRPLPVRCPVLWVHSRNGDAGLPVTVLATCLGWSYVNASDTRTRWVGWCSDRAGAVAEIDGRLMAQISAQDGPAVPLRFGRGQ
ncbi:hypothetical protein ACIBI3_21960 [Actinomadura luteofluorescens]|uniref:hypothetical protein n=1 Tax=Actinomadura luteofluorescens TaxID=46163 RepID=UPI00346A2E2E